MPKKSQAEFDAQCSAAILQSKRVVSNVGLCAGARLGQVLDIAEKEMAYQRGALIFQPGRGQHPVLLAHARGHATEADFRSDMRRVRHLLAGNGNRGVVRHSIDTGDTMILEDCLDEELYVAADWTMRSELCLSVDVGFHAKIALNFESEKTGHFGEQDHDLASILLSEIIPLVRTDVIGRSMPFLASANTYLT